jgi:hypothetical protein
MWKAQVIPIVRGAHLFRYLDGTAPEPVRNDSTHAVWIEQDQQLLSFINASQASLSQDVLSHVATCTTSATVWKEISAMFSSQSRERTIQLCTRLSTTCKGEQSVVAYYNKMIDFADEMVAAGKPLEDEDFISYVLGGLDQDYNSFIENVVGKTKISLGSMHSQLLVAEAGLEHQSSQSQYQSSVNSASRERGSYRG